MASENIKILEYNQYQKYDKTTFIIYVNFESVRQKMDQCKNNPEKLSISKRSEHISSRFSISRILSFRDIQNKYDVYRGKKYIKKFCRSLRKYAVQILKKKKMRL